MKESIGYTVTLNIMITFIIIVFAFLSATLIYFKSNKVSNIITDSIEKYEGYNDLSKSEIQQKLVSVGYNRKPVGCNRYYNRIDSKLKDGNTDNGECPVSGIILDGANDGYCVFVCSEKGKDNKYYYYYKISTNLIFNVPIVNELLDIPIFSNTNRLYDFEANW